MKIKGKRLVLLFAGGTALADGDSTVVEKPADMRVWLDKMPALDIMAKIEPIFICGESEALSGRELWAKISQAVYQHLPSADGFIVISSLNNILYNAIAVAFALPNINKPVIFTGSLWSLGNELTDIQKKGLGLKADLVNVAQIATMNLPAVGLMLGNRCLSPFKARKGAAGAKDIFSSLDEKYLANIDFGISLVEKMADKNVRPQLKSLFDNKVVSIRYYPGFDFSCLKDLASSVSGLFIEGETLPEDFFAQLKKIKKPVLCYNCLVSSQSGAENIMAVSNMTRETALVKFMWALGQSFDPPKVKEIINTEYCGEFLANQQ